MNKAISDYMREMQRRSAESRWSGLSAAERSAKMKALRAKGKPKRIARRSNVECMDASTAKSRVITESGDDTS